MIENFLNFLNASYFVRLFYVQFFRVKSFCNPHTCNVTPEGLYRTNF
jgi:hypothetical protein